MTDTQQSAPRFALDEARAAEFIKRGSDGYNPASPACAGVTAELVHRAVDDGVITDPLHRDAVTLAFEYVGACDGGEHCYRWLLSADTGDGPDDYVTVASQAAELAGISIFTGANGALDVLREAVAAGNMLAGELGRYVTSLPLAARAPELADILEHFTPGDIRCLVRTAGEMAWAGCDRAELSERQVALSERAHRLLGTAEGGPA